MSPSPPLVLHVAGCAFLLQAVLLASAARPAAAQSIYVGPTPYASPADVPTLFYASGAATALENFEDCTLDAGGITGTSTQVITKDFRPGGCIATNQANVDSVDVDDGAVDGSGVDGASYFSSNFFEFVFPTPVTAAGLVYTDGPGPVYFEAFGPGHVSLGQIGPFMLDDGQNGTVADDQFLGVKNLGGIESIEIFLPAGAGAEVDHVQYGAAATLVAGWDDGQALQGSGGLDPALWVGLDRPGASPPAVTTPDSETLVLTYDGLDPNPLLQIDVASYGLPFYPPDPVKVVGSQIQVVFMDGGTMATLTIDVASSSGGFVDPLSVVGFNPQPEPPAARLFAFDPPPVGDSEALSIQVPLSGGSGAPGGTQISLTLQLLDDAMAPLPASPVAMAQVPATGAFGLFLLAGALVAAARGGLRRRGANGSRIRPM